MVNKMGRRKVHEFGVIGHDTETGEEYAICSHCGKYTSSEAKNFKGEERKLLVYSSYDGAPARLTKHQTHIVPKAEIEQRFAEGKIRE